MLKDILKEIHGNASVICNNKNLEAKCLKAKCHALLKDIGIEKKVSVAEVIEKLEAESTPDAKQYLTILEPYQKDHTPDIGCRPPPLPEPRPCFFKQDYWVALEELRSHPENENFFAVDEDVLSSLTEEFKENGYSSSFPPLVVVKGKDDELGIIDGVTRLKAAADAGLKKLPVKIVEMDRHEIIEFIVKNQCLRRNKNPAVLLSAVQALSEIEARRAKKRQGNRNDLTQEDNFDVN